MATTESVSVAIPTDLLEAAKAEAKACDRSFSWLVTQALRKEIKFGSKPPPVQRDLVRLDLKEPTEAEVDAYIKEKGYQFTAKSFVGYYGSQGWRKANGQKLTNWRLACDTFDRKERKRDGTHIPGRYDGI
jgi:hypothetical protein